MKHKKQKLLPVLAILGTVLLIVGFSAIPVLTLWVSERAALDTPHARTAQAGAVSLTCDDMYITRMLKKLVIARETVDSGYRNASYYPDSMSCYESYSARAQDIAALIETAHTEGFLPDAWYESVHGALDGPFYTSTDSLGFMNCIAYSAREGEEGIYLIGLTVETETNAIVGMWATAGGDEALPAPDTAAVLAAYMRYLGVEQANDWGVPVDTGYAENSIYSANAELLLSVQTGEYNTWPEYTITQYGVEHARRYFCLNAKYLENDKIQQYQAYTRSFAGVPDMPSMAGEMHTVQWRSGTWGELPCMMPDACYELAVCGMRIDAQTGGSITQRLLLKTDYATRRQSPLCSQPNCMHEDASCPAYTEGSVLLAGIGEKLYMLYEAGGLTSQQESNRARLEVIDPAAGTRRLLCTFPVGCEMYSGSLVCTDGYALYGTMYEERGEAIGARVDLTTGAISYWTLSDGTGYATEMLGAAGTGIVVANDVSYNAELCPPVAEREKSWVRKNDGESVQCIYYDIATGLRRELSLPQQILDGKWDVRPMLGSYTPLYDGKFYGIDATLSEKGQTIMLAIWQVDILTGEMRKMEEIYVEEYTDWYIVDVLPAMGEGQQEYLKVYCYPENGTEVAIYLLGVERPETLKFSAAYNPKTSINRNGPVSQTVLGDTMLMLPSSLATTWDDGRSTYALASLDALLAGRDELTPIDMWVPAPALG